MYLCSYPEQNINQWVHVFTFIYRDMVMRTLRNIDPEDSLQRKQHQLCRRKYRNKVRCSQGLMYRLGGMGQGSFSPQIFANCSVSSILIHCHSLYKICLNTIHEKKRVQNAASECDFTCYNASESILEYLKTKICLGGHASRLLWRTYYSFPISKLKIDIYRTLVHILVAI